MSRFFFGFLCGALALAFVQFTYAPLPVRSDSASGWDNAQLPPAAAVHNAAQDSSQSTTGAVASQGVRAQTPTSSIAGNASDADDQDADDANTRRGPANPIELPETHAGFVKKTSPSLPDEHASLEEEDVDSGWAEFVENQIYSHVSAHPQGESIAIVSLVCRTTRCEIAGTVYGEQGGDVWQAVLTSLREQTWFANNFSPSMYGAGGGLPGEFRFLNILPRVGTEISAPFDP